MAVQGVVRTYDPTTGIGVVVRDDDGAEVYLRAGSLAGSIFRFVRQGQRIVFDIDDDAGMPVVSNVRVGQEGY
ncbi:MAG: cold shock domain-containing protein [Acidimicrobiia bacterium]|nr:cold shock domain-containing protein [Acidimicrobiia bacterium]MDH4308477.1 cold shock domain-containing protein [Acidimicrobiia bacterium]MDH5292621.1 cold shock domain-containing protein [Acidimicrobiia bacterium]